MDSKFDHEDQNLGKRDPKRPHTQKRRAKTPKSPEEEIPSSNQETETPDPPQATPQPSPQEPKAPTKSAKRKTKQAPGLDPIHMEPESDEKPIEKTRGGRGTLSDKVQAHREAANLDAGLVQQYVESVTLQQICEGINNAGKNDFNLHMEEIRTQKSQIEAIENQHKQLADEIFRGKRTSENPYAEIKENPKDTNWFVTQAKTNHEKNHDIMATFIELAQKKDPKETPVQHTKTAMERVPTQIKKIKNTCNQSGTTTLAILKLTRDIYKLHEKKADGTLTEVEMEERTQTLKDQRAQIAATEKQFPDIQKLAQEIEENFLLNDKRREELHEISKKLQNPTLDNSAEKQGLEMLPTPFQDTYKSKTMDMHERRDFWKQAAKLTKGKLTSETATKLLTLQLGIMARERTEVASLIAEQKNQAPLQELKKHNQEITAKKKSDAHQKDSMEQRSRGYMAQDINNAKQLYEQVTQETSKGLSLDSR
jgi:hypothetical protein